MGREGGNRGGVAKGGMKPTEVFRTHFGMRAAAGSAGLAGSVLFSATGSTRLINRAGAGAAGTAGTAGTAAAVAAGGASVRLAAAVADEGSVLMVVSPAEPCWKESTNRANSRRGSETRKRKDMIFFPKAWPVFREKLVVFGGLGLMFGMMIYCVLNLRGCFQKAGGV